MKRVLNILLWLLFWPIRLPIWLWKRSLFGKIITLAVLLIMLGVILTLPDIVSNGDFDPAAPSAPPVPETTAIPDPPVQKDTKIPIGATAAAFLTVIDGDTITVSIQGSPETIRYIGIDTPERGQPGWRAATEANKALIQDTPLYLLADRSDRDRYDRLLRYVYTADGTFVNAQLIADGWAQPAEYPPDTSHAAEFLALAQEAASHGAGFWRGESPYDGAMAYGLITATADVNIRSGPGTDYDIVGAATFGFPVTIFGRNESGDWFQIRTPDRQGGWVHAPLIQTNAPMSQIPVSQNIPATGEPAVLVVASTSETGQTIDDIGLVVIENKSTFEILELHNLGSEPVDVSGWTLYGSKGDDRCTMPASVVLQPGATYQVATGDSQPLGDGFKCGDKPIWSNKGEEIYLESGDGQMLTFGS
jgi:endonuclease YncB( thermonuclease family)